MKPINVLYLSAFTFIMGMLFAALYYNSVSPGIRFSHVQLPNPDVIQGDTMISYMNRDTLVIVSSMFFIEDFNSHRIYYTEH